VQATGTGKCLWDAFRQVQNPPSGARQ
jgi:hypothetical protein